MKAQKGEDTNKETNGFWEKKPPKMRSEIQQKTKQKKEGQK